MQSIYEIRRLRLVELVKLHDDNRTANLTERMKWKSPGLAKRYLTPTGEGNHKPIGAAVARQLEAAYKKEENYLDNWPPGDLSPTEADLLRMFRRLTSHDLKQQILGKVREAFLSEGHLEYGGPTVFESDVRERHETVPASKKRQRAGAG